MRRSCGSLPGPGTVDGLVERAVGALVAHQEVGAEQTLVEQATVVLAEILVVARFQLLPGAQQAPGGERQLLGVEVTGRILVRQVDAIVARGVVPATVDIERSRRAVGMRKMSVGLVQQAAGALALEVVDDVGERVSLEHVVLNLEGRRTQDLPVDRNFHVVAARSMCSAEVGHGVAAVPAGHLARRRKQALDFHAAAIGVDQAEDRRSGNVDIHHDGLLDRAGVVTDLVDQHLPFGRQRTLRNQHREDHRKTLLHAVGSRRFLEGNSKPRRKIGPGKCAGPVGGEEALS